MWWSGGCAVCCHGDGRKEARQDGFRTWWYSELGDMRGTIVHIRSYIWGGEYVNQSSECMVRATLCNVINFMFVQPLHFFLWLHYYWPLSNDLVLQEGETPGWPPYNSSNDQQHCHIFVKLCI